MILPWLILIPFIGGLLCWQCERFGNILPRWIALLTMALLFGLSLWLWATGDFSLAPAPGAAPQWAAEFQLPWIERFGISVHLALDGLSVLMISLTGLLGVLSVLCSWNEIQNRVGFFHLNLMWILGGVVGVFLAVDLFLFFFFWEMMLVPMYFLIALWGHSGSDGKTRITAATKFFIFTQASGLIMLLAILGLVFVHFDQTGVLTFNYADLLNTKMAAGTEYILMLGFFIAFAVKFPVVPFHSWLPDAHAQAPTAGSVDLAGILLKTAAYGLMRFALPLFPNASAEFAPIAQWLGVFAIIYGGFAALAQTDLKKLVAYSSVAHLGFIVLGTFALTDQAVTGGVMQMVNHGVSTGALSRKQTSASRPLPDPQPIAVGILDAELAHAVEGMADRRRVHTAPPQVAVVGEDVVGVQVDHRRAWRIRRLVDRFVHHQPTLVQHQHRPAPFVVALFHRKAQFCVELDARRHVADGQHGNHALHLHSFVLG